MDGNEEGKVTREQFVSYFDANLEKDEIEFEKTLAQFAAVAKACRKNNSSSTRMVSPRKLSPRKQNLSPERGLSPPQRGSTRVITPRGE